jgi:membrane fusion protein (multidrug efflux system)
MTRPTDALRTAHATSLLRLARRAGFGLLLAALAACEEQPTRASANSNPPPPIAVTVVAIKRREIPITSMLPGRTAPFRVAEVRPEVGGVLQERLFTEGQFVEAGQPLFQIAPATLEAALRRAEAALTRHEAAERAALGTVTRLRALASAQAVSEQNLENAEPNLRQIQADITSARAAIETARIDLGYARVASPISGRTGR